MAQRSFRVSVDSQIAAEDKGSQDRMSIGFAQSTCSCRVNRIGVNVVL